MKNAIILSFAASFLVAGSFAFAQDNPPEKKASSFVIAPAVSSSPGFGNGLGAVGLYFFKPNKADHVSPASTLTAVGMYSDTDSYFTGLFGKVHLQEDTWRLLAGLPHGRINSSLDAGATEQARFENIFYAGVLEAQRKISGAWYSGVRFIITDQAYTPKNQNGQLYLDTFDVEDTRNSKVAALVSYDSRDDQRYPESGSYGEAVLTYAPEKWTDSEEYYVGDLSAASFFTLAPNQILALQGKGKTVTDDAPYYERPTLGSRGDLRGYTPGEIVGDHQILLQVEYRTRFNQRFGGVLFGGGSAIWEENLSSEDLYWNYGAGIRIRIQEENRVNFRIDYAIGEDDQDGWYVSVSEAF